MKSIATFLLVLALAQANAQILPAFGGSRSGTTGMQFLKIGPDARSNALAGSVVGEINDAAAIFWNPAGAVELDSQKLHLQTGNVQYFGGIGINHGSVVFQPEQYRSFSFGIMNFRSPEMDVTTEFMPQGTGQTYALNDLLMAFSFSQVLTDNFRFGITLKYANENVMGVVSQAGLFDFGFQYAVGLKDLMFGVAISNFGFNVNPQGEVTLTTLSGFRNVDEFEEFAVPASFRMGFSGSLYNKGMHSVKGMLQLNHPTDNQETVSMGVEYVRNDLLFMRTGYLLGFTGTYPTFGAGVNLKRRFGTLRFDYAFVARQGLGFNQQFTLGFSII